MVTVTNRLKSSQKRWYDWFLKGYCSKKKKGNYSSEF